MATKQILKLPLSYDFMEKSMSTSTLETKGQNNKNIRDRFL